MIEFFMLAVGSSLMAYQDIKTKGYETFEPIAILLAFLGFLNTVLSFNILHIVILCLTAIVSSFLYSKNYWGSSDTWLAIACVGLLPFLSAVLFPFALMLGSMIFMMPFVYKKLKAKKSINLWEEVPFIPAFPIAIMLLWVIV